MLDMKLQTDLSNIDELRSRERLLYIPEVLRTTVIEWAHSHPTAGHIGITKTLDKLGKDYYWPQMPKSVKVAVATCPACQFQRATANLPPLAPIERKLLLPFDDISIDILGPMPKTAAGNEYVLVVMDRLTKWPEAFPLPDKAATTVAKALVEGIVCRHGCPTWILTDRGGEFTAEVARPIGTLP
eukprot:TRINITY_DN4895_c0_g1::TRINITY_DN4895_c0_g1_i1::g.911::m.911 TRINITY_DN4895_c0_g1::TRINITY_DN4895_c0_g1_i1::g.911  ORF type:complete len:185 (-),score=-14.09,sp/P10394/POL4_DROME/35.14/1e-22,rve/PF00665.21/1.6e-10,zf-H2C2/PF09337.5/7.8e-05,zf-H2C2/PF09337.5/4.2e+03 TRINITY_DN4895_c0_g1_i1:259-813(-)